MYTKAGTWTFNGDKDGGEFTTTHLEQPLDIDEGVCTDECFRYEDAIKWDNTQIRTVKTDIFAWAVFVWRLMTNCFSKRDPCFVKCGGVYVGHSIVHFPNGRVYGPQPREHGYHGDVLSGLAEGGEFVDTGEERLGPILIKCWKGEYESCEEVMADVRTSATKLGREVSGELTDEILPSDGRS